MWWSACSAEDHDSHQTGNFFDKVQLQSQGFGCNVFSICGFAETSQARYGSKIGTRFNQWNQCHQQRLPWDLVESDACVSWERERLLFLFADMARKPSHTLPDWW